MPRYDDEGPGILGYLLRLVVVLLLVGGVGLAGFAWFGALGRPTEPRSLPVTLPQG